ncbi:MAG: hypothetical protein ACTSW1_08185 [Candidatus Hodarchaeales archaeon]
MASLRKKKTLTINDTPYDGIESRAKEVQKISRKVRRDIDKTVRERYSTTSPLVLYALLELHITNANRQMKTIANNSYNETMNFTKAQMKQVYGARYTTKEIKNLLKDKSSLLSTIGTANKRMKTDLRRMLLQNISGRISFKEMTTGIANLYPAYESQAYTIVNSSLQRAYRSATWAKESKIMDYFRYQGPIIATSRDYCISRAGKVYTKAGAATVQAEMQTFYNCGHDMVGITKEEYDAGEKGPI